MSGSQKFVYQKWPDQIFPIVNFVFSRDGHFGLGGGGVRGGAAVGRSPPTHPTTRPPSITRRGGAESFGPNTPEMTHPQQRPGQGGGGGVAPVLHVTARPSRRVGQASSTTGGCFNDSHAKATGRARSSTQCTKGTGVRGCVCGGGGGGTGGLLHCQGAWNSPASPPHHHRAATARRKRHGVVPARRDF